MKRTGIRRSRANLGRRRNSTPGTHEQKIAFKRDTLLRHGYECAVLDDGHHDGVVQAHHVVPQEKLKHYASAVDLEDDQLAELLWDPTNGLAVCRRHHDRHTLARRRIPLSVLTLDHLRFAAGLGLGYVIENSYRLEEGDRRDP